MKILTRALLVLLLTILYAGMLAFVAQIANIDMAIIAGIIMILVNQNLPKE